MTLLASACVQKRPSKIDEVRRVEVVAKYTHCPQAEKPELKPLHAEKHIGAKENVEVLMFNAVEQNAYDERLEAENQCYRAQAEK